MENPPSFVSCMPFTHSAVLCGSRSGSTLAPARCTTHE